MLLRCKDPVQMKLGGVRVKAWSQAISASSAPERRAQTADCVPASVPSGAFGERTGLGRRGSARGGAARAGGPTGGDRGEPRCAGALCSAPASSVCGAIAAGACVHTISMWLLPCYRQSRSLLSCFNEHNMLACAYISTRCWRKRADWMHAGHRQG